MKRKKFDKLWKCVVLPKIIPAIVLLVGTSMCMASTDLISSLHALAQILTQSTAMYMILVAFLLRVKIVTLLKGLLNIYDASKAALKSFFHSLVYVFVHLLLVINWYKFYRFDIFNPISDATDGVFSHFWSKQMVKVSNYGDFIQKSFYLDSFY